MPRHRNILRFAGTFIAALSTALQAAPADQVRLASGVVEGTTGKNSSVRVFLGIPYAAPPVGDSRWKAPQPAPAWSGVRTADHFGARCVQADIYGDMIFKDAGMSE